ncbi:hypothetical protein J3Q64DRAFT_1697451 [Phycomyces blakesleeanus]|uniref:Uncharacterized protein n=1 Tax=Phycomyces blakesleeanus TaxID=4837 RepID=A0ABR3B2A0_PHYBL
MGSFSNALCLLHGQTCEKKTPLHEWVQPHLLTRDRMAKIESRAHDNVMRQTILGLVSNWVGSLWSTGSRTTGEPSGGLLSERQGGILGHSLLMSPLRRREDVFV